MTLFTDKQKVECNSCGWKGYGYHLEHERVCPDCGFATHLDWADQFEDDDIFDSDTDN